VVELTAGVIVVATFLLAIIIELATCFLRFVLGKESAKDTTFIGEYTFGVRIHHGYVGAVILLLCYYLGIGGIAGMALSCIGWALILSDAFHHCLLRHLTGSFCFDLLYRNPPS